MQELSSPQDGVSKVMNMTQEALHQSYLVEKGVGSLPVSHLFYMSNILIHLLRRINLMSNRWLNNQLGIVCLRGLVRRRKDMENKQINKE